MPDLYANAVSSGAFPQAFDATNPAAPFLPPDLFDSKGPWVLLGEKPTSQGQPITKLAPRHVELLSRSVFLAYLRFPGGRSDTLEYLRRLAEFPSPLVVSGRITRLSEKLPEFAHGTQVALVRRALLVDAAGEIVPSPLVESVQIRTFTPDRPMRVGAFDVREAVHEFVLSPRKLLAGEKTALRPVEPSEVGFDQFGNLSDQFELRSSNELAVHRRAVYESCHACHEPGGVHGFLVHARNFGTATPVPPTLVESTLAEREQASIHWKRQRRDWGLFQGMSKAE